MKNRKNSPPFKTNLIFSILLAVLLAITFAFYSFFESSTDMANELRHQSILRVNEFLQSSDDETRIARLYVATANPIYKKYFYDLVDIREGKKPRPENYHKPYWSIYIATGNPPRPDSKQTISVIELIKKQNLTEAEILKLEEAKQKSDLLVFIELEAINLVNESSPNREDNRDKALIILTNQTYLESKASFMETVSEFYEMIDNRTQNTVQQSKNNAFIMRIIFILLGLGLCFSFWRTYDSLQNILGGSLDNVQSKIKEIEIGNFAINTTGEIFPKGSILYRLREMQITLGVIDSKRREAEERSKNIIATAPDGIIIINEKGIVQEFNPAAERIFGYAPEEVIGQNVSILMPAPFKEQHDQYIENYLLSGIAKIIGIGREVLGLRKDKSKFPMYLSISLTKQEKEKQFIGIVHDLSQSKIAEDNALKSQERLRAFMDAATESFSIFDSDLNMIDFNNSSLKWLEGAGWTRETVIGKNILEITPLLKGTERLKAYQEVIKTGNPYSTDFSVKNLPSLGERFVNIKAFKVGSGMGLISTDTTNLRQLEQSILEQKQHLEHILNNLLTGVVQINLEGQIVYANQAASNILGIKKDEVTNRYFNDRDWKQIDEDGNLLPLDKLPLAVAMIEKRIVTNIEHGIIDEKENRKWLIVNAFPLLDSENNLQGAIANFIDITERKVAEDLLVERGTMLLRNEIFIRTIADNLPGMVGYWTKDLRNRFANEKYLEWFGKTKSQMHGIHIRDLLGEKIYGMNLPYIQKALNGEKISFERTLVKANGETGYTWAHYIPDIDSDTGTVLGFFVLVSDITELKQTELALAKAKENADIANRAKSEFLASMSHEIRTPLNGVIGFTDLLLKTKLNDTQSQYMSIVNESANSLMDLLNDILDFSKIEAGKLELSIDKVDIYELTKQASDVIKYKAFEKKLEVLLSIPPTLPRFIYTDPVRLRQIIINLLGNAVKFTKEGEIELTVEILETSEKKTNNFESQLLFSVRDTGIGISKETQAKIFEAFSQEDSSTTRKYGGTGLGLTISNKLLGLMNSKLELESEKGKGSKFYFTLNCKIEDGEKLIWEGLENIKNVLVVDDNSSNRLILKDMLALQNIQSDIATNAFEALDLLRNNKTYNVMITDYDMPEMDGIGLVGKIREDKLYVGEDLSIIMLHSTSNTESLDKLCKDLNIQLRIQKPIKMAELFNALKRLKNNNHLESIKTKPDTTLRERVSKISGTIKILVVDDDAVNMFLAKSILSQLLPSAILLEASDGEDALAEFENSKPDIILMDIQMPKMNGYESTLEIRKLKDGEKVTIIAVSAGTVKEDIEKCFEVGMDDYVSKPIVKNRVEEILKKWLGYDRQIDRARFEEANSNHFDIIEFKARFGNDKQFLSKIIETSKSIFSSSVSDLKNALKAKNMEAIHRIAHKTKGTALNLCCGELAKLAIEMEMQKEYNEQLLSKMIKDFENEIEMLIILIIKEVG